MFNMFRRKSIVERMADSACDAGKTAAKVVGTCAIGTLYGIGAVAVAMGEAAAQAEARKAEARKEACEARRVADEAERKAREAERKAYGVHITSDGSIESRHRYTSCNGMIYEIMRKYTGMCTYSVEVRRYCSGKIVRIEDTYGISAAIDCERRWADEIRRGYMD